MAIWSTILLAIVQGATEFIPVSSSAHLVILPTFFKVSQPTLFFDVSLHFGTFLALLIYFRKEIIGFFKSSKENFNLFVAILIATFPAVLAGVLFKDFFEKIFQKPLWAAFFLIINGLLLILAERLATFKKEGLNLNCIESLMIGVAQAFAIFPGISRSGATISAGLFLGLKREEAARFSFLLALPIFLGTFLFEIKDLTLSHVPLLKTAIGVLVSFVTGYLVIDFLLKYLKKGSLYLFAFYCLLVGLTSAWWLK